MGADWIIGAVGHLQFDVVCNGWSTNTALGPHYEPFIVYGPLGRRGTGKC